MTARDLAFPLCRAVWTMYVGERSRVGPIAFGPHRQQSMHVSDEFGIQDHIGKSKGILGILNIKRCSELAHNEERRPDDMVTVGRASAIIGDDWDRICTLSKHLRYFKAIHSVRFGHML